MLDAFGKMMVHNLKMRHIELNGVSACTSTDSHIDRFKGANFAAVKIWLISEVYRSFSRQTTKRCVDWLADILCVCVSWLENGVYRGLSLCFCVQDRVDWDARRSRDDEAAVRSLLPGVGRDEARFGAAGGHRGYPVDYWLNRLSCRLFCAAWLCVHVCVQIHILSVRRIITGQP